MLGSWITTVFCLAINCNRIGRSSSLVRTARTALIALLSVTLTVLPFSGAQAQTQAAAPDWAAHAARSRSWSHLAVSAITQVRVPADNWLRIGTMRIDRNNDPQLRLRMIDGDRWITLNREEVGALGISSAQMSNLMMDFAGGPSAILARYEPATMQLRVQVIKTEKSPDGTVSTYIGDFTPHHGQRWAAGRHFLTSAEASDPYRAGRNPFEHYRASRPGGLSEADPVFYNISPEQSWVVVGMAMRHYNALTSFIANAELRQEQGSRCSGNVLRKSCTHWRDFYAKPTWVVGLPYGLQPHGSPARMCATAAQDCDDADPQDPRWAYAHATFYEWEGGNMPSQEDHVHRWEHTQSGLTVLSMVLIVFAVVFTAGWAITGSAGFFAGGAAGGAGAGGGLGGLGWGTIGAVGYAGGSTVLHSGGGLTQTQRGAFGSTGNGYSNPTAVEPEFDIAAQKTRDRLVTPNAPSQTLSAVGALHAGNCPESYKVSECRAMGMDPGTIKRPDSHLDHNGVLQLREDMARCRALGLTGDALVRCVVPRRADTAR